MKKPRLIRNARQAWRMLSVQISALAAILSAAWIATPDDKQAQVLAFLGLDPSFLAPIAFVAVILGRVLAQPMVDDK